MKWMCTAVIDPLTGLYTAIATWDTYNITETVVTNMNYSVIVSLDDNYNLHEQLIKTTTIPLLVSEIGLWAFACNLIVVSITILLHQFTISTDTREFIHLSILFLSCLFSIDQTSNTLNFFLRMGAAVTLFME